LKDKTYDICFHFEDCYWWFVARANIILDWVSRYSKKNQRVLDYGCGSGRVSQLLQEQGVRLDAADVSEKALGYCKERGIQNLINLQNQEPQESAYDMVILCDVLEHVENHEDLLRSIRKLLKDKGKLLITVPAFSWLWSGQDFVSNHFRRYTKRELLKVVKGSGFKPLKSSYYNTFLFPIVAGVIFLKRLFKPRSMYETDIEEMPKWTNRILTGIFRSEKWFLRFFRFPFGVSIVSVCERSADHST